MPSIGIPSELNRNNTYSNVNMARPEINSNNSNKSSNQDNIKNQEEMIGTDGNPKMDREVLDRINGGGFKEDIYKSKYKKDVGKEEFLKMLTFQLQNQDPMKPMDQMQMTGELAQLSQLEQTTQMKNIMEKQNSGRLLETKFYGAGLLGKKVYGKGDQIQFDGNGSVAKLRFDLKEPSTTVIAKLLDKKGNIVFQKTIENLSSGQKELDWKGEMLDGGIAGPGSYQLQVSAYDNQKSPLPVETQMTGVVNGVEYQNGDVILIVDNNKIDLRNVDRFEVPAQIQTPSQIPIPSINLPTNTAQELMKNSEKRPNIVNEGFQNEK